VQASAKSGGTVPFNPKKGVFPMRMTLMASAMALGTFGGLAHAQAATYTIDPMHTYVTFEANHLGTSTNRGRFDKKEGAVQFDRASKSGKVELTLDTGSINTGSAIFDKELQSDHFLNSAVYPKAKFVADGFTFDGDKVSVVSGHLTLLGKTNPVALKATSFNCYMHPILKREVCGGDFETTIQRSQWGMSWGLNYGVPDDVKLVVQVEAVKQ
jgi:polyisoprenoid-binding protein YceI